ncbi:MAG: hypothetical protein HQL99_14820 [Magnetococcales bacterium]|nr:hypothetical protein [Magnetococcales bacterium]
MPNHKNTFTLLHTDPEERQRVLDDPYWNSREKLLQLLIHYTLIESYRKFVQKRMPYPFVTPTMARPGAATATKEHTLHNTCLITLVDAPLPSKLRKHFRCREGNRVTRDNIADVAPDLTCLENYDDSHKDTSHESFPALLRMLLPLDYSLLIQNAASSEQAEKKMELSNFHMRIERLTDNALRHMGIHLNYLERSLLEKGDSFVETLEKKLFEYYNFYHNAGGRRAAAVHAAQLLMREKLAGTILVGSQQDRRLTLLTTNGKNQQTRVEQFFLVKLENGSLSELIAFGKQKKIDVKNHFIINPGNHHEGLVILRIEYQHTESGQPSADAKPKKMETIHEKWLRIKEEAIIPIVPDNAMRIGYSFSEQQGENNPQAECGSIVDG